MTPFSRARRLDAPLCRRGGQ